VVFTARVSPGAHTLKLRNLTVPGTRRATAKRIDVDAFVVIEEG
jgi:hypothetical protein